MGTIGKGRLSMHRRNLSRTGLLIVLVALVVSADYARGWAAVSFISSGLAHLANRTQPVSLESALLETESKAAPEFAAGIWINSRPLTLKNLRGHVVLVEFWTFGCYNCRNTLPTVKSWHARYRDKGLTVVGVHSPELDNERDIANVRSEVASLEIHFPVLTDNDFATWKRYGVEAWPTLFILDKSGRVRWRHVGEGAYDDAEQIIQQLLTEDEQSRDKAKPVRIETAEMKEKIIKNDEEWRRQLSPDEYYVLRQSGTEPAFTGAYWANHEKGVYYCAACGLALFSSDAKYDSGTGWPSFFAPVSETNVITETDNSLGMARTEVKCRRCGSHLGHVFDDGPRPSGLRYCMNSVSLKFEKKP